MRISTGEVCLLGCGSPVTVYLYNSIRKTNEKCLPAWRRCGCGWEEICTAELASLVPDWKDYFAKDVEGIELE